jgi:hypothetical protein
MLSDIIAVEVLPDYRLRLSFKTGDAGEISVAQILNNDFSGIFQPLKDEAYFRQVSVNPDIGTIVWPNGADIAPNLLYKHAVKNAPLNAT